MLFAKLTCRAYALLPQHLVHLASRFLTGIHLTIPLPHFLVAVYNAFSLRVACLPENVEWPRCVRSSLPGDHGQYHRRGGAGQRTWTVPQAVPRVRYLEYAGSE